MGTRDFSLDYICPICWAQPEEQCEMNNGYPRFESHRERRNIGEENHQPQTLRKDLKLFETGE